MPCSVEINPVALGKKIFFYFRQCIFAIWLLSPLEKDVALSLNKLQYFVPSLVEIGSVVLNKIFKYCQCIIAFLLLSPLGKGCGPSFEPT